MYSGCGCNHPLPALASGDLNSLFTDDELDEFLRGVHAGAYANGQLDVGRASKYAGAFSQAVTKGYGKSLGDVDFDTPDAAMLRALQSNVFHFSAAKNKAEILCLSGALRDEQGKLRSWATFRREAADIIGPFQTQYLRAEYDLAVGTSTMAARWVEYKEDPSAILEYRTAGDKRVRYEHRLLDGISRPVSDPFWSTYYPPNGWNCRCDVQKTLSGRITPDSDIPAGAIDGVPPMFRTNFAEHGFAFPPDHPYFAGLPPSFSNALINNEVRTLADFNRVLSSYADQYPEDFHHGFRELLVERGTANGKTNLQGTIWLQQDRIDNCIGLLNNIREGRPTSFAQEDAVSTLWHEITHNMHKLPAPPLTTTARMDMELANELVSRKTVDKFIGRLGGNMQHPELMATRVSTGYNGMVVNYEKAITRLGLDKRRVLETVADHLFNQPYDKQLDGLVRAIAEQLPKKTKKTAVKGLVRACSRSYTFDSALEEFITSLPTR